MDREALRHRLKSRLDELVDDLLTSPMPPRTIDEIEDAALKLREKAGQLVAEELAHSSEEQARAEAQQAGEGKKLRCTCGRWARSRGDRERDVVTLAGRLRVRRRYYYCRACDAGFCPADRVLGVGGGVGSGLFTGPFTRRVVQEVVRLDALLPYEKAVGLLGELTGVSVSAKEAQRMLERTAAVVASFQEARWGTAVSSLSGPSSRLHAEGRAGGPGSGGPESGGPESGGPGSVKGQQAQNAPEVLYLSADGVQTPIVGGWREMKVGLARRVGANGRVQGQTRYVSLLGDAEAFGWEWAALAEGAGAACARLVVVVGDGARWIWNQADLHFPDAIQILDVWHATERLWEVGRLAFGPEEASREALQEWMKERQAQLWEYRTDALLGALAEVARGVRGMEAAREKAQEAIGYFQNNRERMDYPRYQRMGLQVGSGSIESACKQVVTQRLKGAGMRWREAGAQTVARLRCLLLGGEWNSFLDHWNKAPLAAAA